MPFPAPSGPKPGELQSGRLSPYDRHALRHAQTPARAQCVVLAAELGRFPSSYRRAIARKGETRSPDYLAKNPNGRVPVLGGRSARAVGIARDPPLPRRQAPERALGGGDHKSEGLVNQWLFWWAGDRRPPIDALLWERIIKPKVLKRPGNDPGILADAAVRLPRFLPVLDRQLEAGDYVIGPLSIADFAIAPRTRARPGLSRIRCRALPQHCRLARRASPPSPIGQRPSSPSWSRRS